MFGLRPAPGRAPPRRNGSKGAVGSAACFPVVRFPVDRPVDRLAGARVGFGSAWSAFAIDCAEYDHRRSKRKHPQGNLAPCQRTRRFWLRPVGSRTGRRGATTRHKAPRVRRCHHPGSARPRGLQLATRSAAAAALRRSKPRTAVRWCGRQSLADRSVRELDPRRRGGGRGLDSPDDQGLHASQFRTARCPFEERRELARWPARQLLGPKLGRLQRVSARPATPEHV